MNDAALLGDLVAHTLKRIPSHRTNFLCPIVGAVSIESLPRDNASELVAAANRERTIRRALEIPSPVSEAEIDLVAGLLFYGAKGFTLQHPLGRYDVDIYWPQERLAIEVDGAAYHDPERDRRRDLVLEHDHDVHTHRVAAERVWLDPLWAARQVAQARGERRASLKARAA